jgi:hypothetical protein
MAASNQAPSQEEAYPESAVIRLSVAVRKNALERCTPDENGWLRLDGGEDVAVTLELSPEAWRQLGRVFSRRTDEPEWRLENQRFPDGSAATPWLDCRPSTSEYAFRGPGGFMHKHSSYLSVRLRDFPSISKIMEG